MKKNQNKKIILASSSIQRKNLLSILGVSFQIFYPQIIENTIFKRPSNIVLDLAFQKGIAVKKQIEYKCIIISADTIVFCKNEIIGKPKSIKDAYRILQKISSNPHFVYTGYCVFDLYRERIYSGYDKTKIIMIKLPNEKIEDFINNHSDKAGCYSIQEDEFIKKIIGDKYNAIGLPLYKIAKILNECGVQTDLIK